MRTRLLIALLCLFVAAPVLAQDATPEPTPVVAPVNNVTVEEGGTLVLDQTPPVSEVPDTPRPLIDSDSILKLVIAIASAIMLGGGGLMVIHNLLKRKDVQDVVERQYQQQPPQTQEVVQGAIALLDKSVNLLAEVLTFARNVTDGKPNTESGENVPPAA